MNVEDDLWVFTPIVVPFPHSRVARRLNALILGITLRRLRRQLGLEEFELWTFLPSVADYIGAFGESLSVYYCVDEFSLFTGMDARETFAAETELLRRVDCVFAVNPALVDAKRRLNPRTHLALHGVEHGLFARALDRSEPVPDDIARLPGPVLGYYGTLEDWVDLELIAEVARRRPDWSIVLIGRVAVDTRSLDELDNVHLLGRRPHTALPDYCRGFDVGLIPYRVDARTPFVNPIKLREYLSAGLPVVSTPLDEALRYAADCAVAGTPDEFVAAVERALEDDTPDAREARSDAMKAESWERRAGSIRRSIDELELPEEPPLPIIAFAKDWHEDPTSNHHVLRELAKTRRVLWLNSIATRTPKLSSGRDVGKIVRKLARVRARPGERRERPVGVHAARAAAARTAALAGAVNRQVLRATIRGCCGCASASGAFQLWTFLPNVAALRRHARRGRSRSTTASTSGRCSATSTATQTVAAESALLGEGRRGVRDQRARSPSKRAAQPARRTSRPHGVDHALFARALDPSDARCPPDLAAPARARASGSTARCATGSTSSCIAHVARARPDW